MAAFNDAAEFEDISVTVNRNPRPSASLGDPPRQISTSRFENARKRKFVRSLKNAVASVANFVETRLKVKNFEYRTLRTVSRLPGLVQTKNKGLKFWTLQLGNIPVRIYTPVSLKNDERKSAGKYSLEAISTQNQTKHGVVLYCHGGSFCLGSAGAYHSFLSALCLETDAVVVAVDYRLCPESPFPACLEDCVQVARCILDGIDIENLPEYQIDRNRLVIAGDECGGTLAINVTLELLRHPARRPVHAVLAISPPLQALTTRLLKSQSNYQLLAHHNRPEWWLPRLVGVSPVSKHLRDLICEDKHAREGWAKLIGHVAPIQVIEIPLDNDQKSSSIDVEVATNVSEIACNPRFWPLLADDQDLAQLPFTMLQSFDRDPLFSEHQRFTERMESLSAKFTFQEIVNAEHCESLHSGCLMSSEASRCGRQQIVNFIKDSLARPPQVMIERPSIIVDSNYVSDETVEDLDDIVPRVLA